MGRQLKKKIIPSIDQLQNLLAVNESLEAVTIPVTFERAVQESKWKYAMIKELSNITLSDRLTDPWPERYIEMYIYIVIRGPRVHHSLTGEFDLLVGPSAATYYHNRIYTYVVYGAVSQRNVWEEFEQTGLQPNTKSIGTNWVYTVKKSMNEVKYKARLVVLGSYQRLGIDYEEVYSPVASDSTI